MTLNQKRYLLIFTLSKEEEIWHWVEMGSETLRLLLILHHTAIRSSPSDDDNSGSLLLAWRAINNANRIEWATTVESKRQNYSVST